MDPGERDLTGRLERLLAGRTGADGVTVDGLTRLAGGAVHHTWAFRAVLSGGRMPGEHDLVLRIDAPGRANPEAMDLEYRLLAVMHACGVPVPRVLFQGDEGFDRPCFVMERVRGETNPGRLVRDDRYGETRDRMVRQLGDVLARIHRASLEILPLDRLRRPPDGQTAAAYEVDELEATYREAALNAHPVLELAFRWLREEAPRRVRGARPLTLVHGDYRVGNFIYDASGLRAVLDWEAAHLGDPMEDLGWLCVRFWRFGQDGLPVGGLGGREALAETYERGGLPVDWEAWPFWEVFGNVRWAVATMTQAGAHLHGRTRSHELAAIGRRTGEIEIEILRLIG